MSKRVLLMYISNNSGHHRASLGIENALRLCDNTVETKCINAFHYTNPVLEMIINKTYMAVIKKKPQIWEYLYDNPAIVKKSQRLKESINRHNSGKMESLVAAFSPDAVVCTQAFPCGIMADLKKSRGLATPLIAVLTDYAPHSYWVYDDVDLYVVPAEESGAKLVASGVKIEKIKVLGIPVDPKFTDTLEKNRLFNKYALTEDKPVVLIMGGGQGLGPISKLVFAIDRSPLDIQLIVVAGTNKRLFKTLSAKAGSFRKKVSVYPFTEDVHEFMEMATLIMTKPGGITTAEALSKRLPMIIVNPLPGQESMNTNFLLEKNLAVKAKDEREALALLQDLLSNRERLDIIKEAIKIHSRPDSALKIADLVLGMAS